MLLDLHIHSCYSKDCSSPVSSILNQACNVGLDAIAICDHNTIQGSLEAERLAEENGLDLLVIPGIEISTTRGHILILGGREEFPKNSNPKDIIEMARRHDCMVVAPHPYKGYPKSLGDVSDLDVDAIETLNSRYILGRFNKRATAMAIKLDLPMLGNSDAHFVEMVGRAYTRVDSEPSVDAIFKAIASGKTTVFGSRTPLSVQFHQAYCGFKRRISLKEYK
jgi:predicted metal-dependent phosphoesterase TrpH